MTSISISRGRENNINAIKTSKRFKYLADNSLVYAQTLAKNHLKKETIEAKINLIIEDFGKQIDKNYNNLSILSKKYQNFCLKINKNPIEFTNNKYKED